MTNLQHKAAGEGQWVKDRLYQCKIEKGTSEEGKDGG